MPRAGLRVAHDSGGVHAVLTWAQFPLPGRLPRDSAMFGPDTTPSATWRGGGWSPQCQGPGLGGTQGELRADGVPGTTGEPLGGRSGLPPPHPGLQINAPLPCLCLPPPLSVSASPPVSEFCKCLSLSLALSVSLHYDGDLTAPLGNQHREPHPPAHSRAGHCWAGACVLSEQEGLRGARPGPPAFCSHTALLRSLICSSGCKAPTPHV